QAPAPTAPGAAAPWPLRPAGSERAARPKGSGRAERTPRPERATRPPAAAPAGFAASAVERLSGRHLRRTLPRVPIMFVTSMSHCRIPLLDSSRYILNMSSARRLAALSMNDYLQAMADLFADDPPPQA